MIKTLIVDDDKLVRMGLISILPWEKHGMKVVGEAKNGEKALEFIENNEVDLLLTDLAMPVMSGMELMRIVRQKHPRIFIVVLTLHQDFEYIQEALRLGAIDYIAKVEMEDENFSDVIERIQARIQVEKIKYQANSHHNTEPMLAPNTGYILMKYKDRGKQGIEKVTDRLKHITSMPLDETIHIWFPQLSEEEQAVLECTKEFIVQHNEWIQVRAEQLHRKQIHEIYRFLKQYQEWHLFYEISEQSSFITLALDNEYCSEENSDELLVLLQKLALSQAWVHDQACYEKFTEQLKQLHLKKTRLMTFIHTLAMSWNQVYYGLIDEQIVAPQQFDSWYEAQRWLEEMRNRFRLAFIKSHYSKEVRECIMKAKQMLHEELSHCIHSADVAKRVNMSRSYFSQCFKDIVGMTFNDYLRQIRIEKSKEYLLHTQKTIQWISENTGYSDAKYFSRVFHELTGQLPSEFRATVEGRDLS